MSKKIVFIAFVVSLGGFLFGFDAGIISGVMSYAGPEFNLNDLQVGWVVSSPSFAAMIAMLIAGKLSDIIGRKKILIVVAFLYALSALLSALASSYEMLYISRMIGGLAFGAALILAPAYIAEISSAKNRGKLVSIQQLNIVFGFFAAFLSNYYFNKYNNISDNFLTDENVWRWMLGVELLPAILYFIFLFYVPKSPRWLYNKNFTEEAKQVLQEIYGKEKGKEELDSIKIMDKTKAIQESSLKVLLTPAFRYIMLIGLTIGILQQITGINAVYFYATSIFKQTGIGTDAAFSSGVLLSFITVLFTFVAIYLIDRMGRRSLMIIGTAGIAISLLLCSYGFYSADYQLTKAKVSQVELIELTTDDLAVAFGKSYSNDIEFKNEVKALIGDQLYAKNEGSILEAAIEMNANFVLIGILGFIACFAFSLGPVMWVLLSELYPVKIRGLAIGTIGFVNSFISWLIQQIFPWELSTLGNGLTFAIFGLIAVIGFFIILKILPETKGKTLEELEHQLIKR